MKTSGQGCKGAEEGVLRGRVESGGREERGKRGRGHYNAIKKDAGNRDGLFKADLFPPEL